MIAESRAEITVPAEMSLSFNNFLSIGDWTTFAPSDGKFKLGLFPLEWKAFEKRSDNFLHEPPIELFMVLKMELVELSALSSSLCAEGRVLPIAVWTAFVLSDGKFELGLFPLEWKAFEKWSDNFLHELLI